MRVLGIDPGSSATGFGVVERSGGAIQLIVCGTIRARTGDLGGRLARIHAEVAAVIAAHGPDVSAIEGVFAARNPRSALTLGQARGAALAACGGAGLVVHEYTPAQVKLAVVGHGRADKAQVQQMVKLQLRLAETPQSDAADAVAIALCHLHRQPLVTAIARAVARAPQP